jgi:hypothetical protein
MKIKLIFLVSALVSTLSGCAAAPRSNPSLADANCAQQCSNNLATCSSGFKFFPVVQQQQCNDNYDVCVRGCPVRTTGSVIEKALPTSPESRLKKLDQLLSTGAISKGEYDAKRKEILDGI